MTQRSRLRVGWCVPTLASNVASVRYRALMPMHALQQAGHECLLFTPTAPPCLSGLDAIIFVKNFQLECLPLAAAARRAGVLVVLDLCDNIFIPGYGRSGRVRPADQIRAMARLADLVVVTTQDLADVVREACPEVKLIRCVPDGIETQAARVHSHEITVDAARRAGGPAGFLRRVRNYLTRPDAFQPRALGQAARAAARILREQLVGSERKTSPSKLPEASAVSSVPRKRVLLWFGNHGAPHANFGMLDLVPLRSELESVARQWPVELVVISNSQEKFERHIACFDLPTRYIEWSTEAVDVWLGKAAVVLVPNSLDAFSRCKSANRTVLALSRRVPVAATPTAALSSLSGVIAMDGFEVGIARYLGDPGLGRRHVERAASLIQEQFGAEAIANAWVGSLREALERGSPDPTASADLVVALNLMQDVDIAEPIISAALAAGHRVLAWTSLSLFKKSPRALSRLSALDVPMVVAPDDRPDAVALPDGVSALLCITETSLRPHRFTRLLVENANAAAITSATVQHGIENVGLTYGDSTQPVADVSIVSERIYLWGPKTTLDPDVDAATRARCIPVGCPKPAMPKVLRPLPPMPTEKHIVGVFENLHWHRYDDEYREAFLTALMKSAMDFPQVLFLVKPHHAGMWLTSRFKGALPEAANILIADPADPKWEPLTAGDLLPALSAVITTPSTVALDAARAGLPVAVVAGTLDLPRYEPLTMLRATGDWLAFIESSRHADGKAGLLAQANGFMDRTLVPGDAAAAIVEDLLGRESLGFVNRNTA